MLSFRSRARWLLLLAVCLGGCSGGAAVTGKVTTGGKEVTAGTIVLSPIAGEDVAAPGKPGVADVSPNGSYSLQLEPGPSGLAQRFTVRFTPPSLQLTAKDTNVVIPYLGLQPKQAEVEVKPGSNVLDIELIPRPQK